MPGVASASAGIGIHGNVNPKQLNSTQYWFFLLLRRQCRDERGDDSRNVG